MRNPQQKILSMDQEDEWERNRDKEWKEREVEKKEDMERFGNKLTDLWGDAGRYVRERGVEMSATKCTILLWSSDWGVSFVGLRFSFIHNSSPQSPTSSYDHRVIHTHTANATTWRPEQLKQR
jgi:coproporphyrinogen III oxidase